MDESGELERPGGPCGGAVWRVNGVDQGVSNLEDGLSKVKCGGVCLSDDTADLLRVLSR